jgi:hypothetical protein
MTITSHGRFGKTQNLTLSATPATSAPVSPQTNKIRLVASAAASITIGDATAVYIPANIAEVALVTAGQTLTAVQFATGGGNLCITEIE